MLWRSWFETRQRVRAKRGPMINSDALLTMRDRGLFGPHPEEHRKAMRLEGWSECSLYAAGDGDGDGEEGAAPLTISK